MHGFFMSNCTVILGSESHGAHDHNLLSDGCGSLDTDLNAALISRLPLFVACSFVCLGNVFTVA
jgi:hypothetical protein